MRLNVEILKKVRTSLAMLSIAAGVVWMARPVSAHHSTAMYDMASPITVKGTVKRFEWTNPPRSFSSTSRTTRGTCRVESS